MVVQHNLTAMNSNRMLGLTQSTLTKSTEKLSSGYKVNRAADDAAGLAISEKMRRQVRGLTQASANAQDGISTVQTAEGALNEVHDMLQRMNELATKAANDTNMTEDRDYIQSELNALSAEIDRVASTTTFNQQNLLDGSFTGKKLQVGAESGQAITISIEDLHASKLSVGTSQINVSTFSNASNGRK
jgi:flagellin